MDVHVNIILAIVSHLPQTLYQTMSSRFLFLKSSACGTQLILGKLWKEIRREWASALAPCYSRTLRNARKRDYLQSNFICQFRGVTRIFQKGVTLCHSEGTHQIVNVIFAICCRLFAQKRLTKGGSQAPQKPAPSYAPVNCGQCPACTCIRRLVDYSRFYSLCRSQYFSLRY